MNKKMHNGHDSQQCRWMFERLSEYIDNELDEVTCKDIEQHAVDCIPCQVCLGTLKRTIEMCKRMEPEPVPAAFSIRLKEMIERL